MAVSRDEIDAICAAFPGAALAEPPEIVSWKVGGKMFACFGGERNMSGVSVKTESIEFASMLIEAGAALRAPYFHRSWVRLPFAETDLDEARHRVEKSYQIVLKTLKKAERDALIQAGGR